MPTVADVGILAKTLGSILAGRPRSHGALTVIPILAPMQTEPEWVTLAEAGDRARITEVGEEGSVPDLKVANLGDLPLLLLDGERLLPGSWTSFGRPPDGAGPPRPDRGPAAPGGLSLRDISRPLAAGGILARNGRPFGPSTLLGVVRNRTVATTKTPGST